MLPCAQSPAQAMMWFQYHQQILLCSLLHWVTHSVNKLPISYSLAGSREARPDFLQEGKGDSSGSLPEARQT